MYSEGVKVMNSLYTCIEIVRILSCSAFSIHSTRSKAEDKIIYSSIISPIFLFRVQPEIQL